LSLGEREIFPLERPQFFVRASFHHFSLMDHSNAIGSFDCRQSVRHDYASSAKTSLVQSILDNLKFNLPLLIFFVDVQIFIFYLTFR